MHKHEIKMTKSLSLQLLVKTFSPAKWGVGSQTECISSEEEKSNECEFECRNRLEHQSIQRGGKMREKGGAENERRVTNDGEKRGCMWTESEHSRSPVCSFTHGYTRWWVGCTHTGGALTPSQAISQVGAFRKWEPRQEAQPCGVTSK